MASKTAETVEQTPEHLSTELASRLQDLPDTFLHCRGIQHRWKIISDMHLTERTADGDLVERHMACESCTTVRKDRWNLRQDRWGVNRLEVLHPTYQYPEDYLVSQMGHVDHAKEVLRFEMLIRALGGKRKLNAARQKVAQQVSE